VLTVVNPNTCVWFLCFKTIAILLHAFASIAVQYILVYFDTGQTAVLLCYWEGNRRYGVTLAVCHIKSGCLSWCPLGRRWAPSLLNYCTHAFITYGGRRSGVFTGICMSVYLPDISKTDTARITKRDIEMFHDYSWKPIYFGVIRSKFKVMSHKTMLPAWVFAVCDCWLLLKSLPSILSSEALVSS